jgi:SAM-dependent methyltransferase
MLRRFLTAIVQGCYKLSALGFKKEHTFTRHAMYLRLRAAANPLGPKTGQVLSISQSAFLCHVLELDSSVTIVEANYPDVSILQLPYADNTFDWVLSDQVLEHIKGDPQTAIDECLRVLKPGGHMVHTTCFLIPYHGPGDYWRYTAEGLSFLCRNAARVVESAGWGNPFIGLFTFLGFAFTPIPVSRWHPITWFALYHRPSYDYVVWVVAQK